MFLWDLLGLKAKKEDILKKKLTVGLKWTTYYGIDGRFKRNRIPKNILLKSLGAYLALEEYIDITKRGSKFGI